MEKVTAVVKNERVTFSFEDGRVEDLPIEVLSCSELLREALSDAPHNQKMSLSCPQGLLRVWLQLVAPPVPQVIRNLQAADFFADKRLLKDACSQAADWLFDRHSSCVAGRMLSFEDRLQVVEELPSHLVILILVSSGQSLCTHLSILPPHWHEAALHAAFPSISSRNALKVALNIPPPEQANRFWQLMGQQTGLTHLTLKLNESSGQHGALSMAPYIGNLTALKHLDLSDCALGDEGAIALAPHLSKLTDLQELGLSANQIGDEGVRALAPSLVNLTNLCHVELLYNVITLEGFRVLCDCTINLKCLNKVLISNDAREYVGGARGVLQRQPSSSGELVRL